MIEEGEIIKVDPSKLIRGPFRRDTLPPNQIIRVHIIHNIINEVFPYPLSERINDLRRDAHPEKEIRIWERIVSAYLTLTENHELGLEQKREVFGALVRASCGPLEEEDFAKCRYATMKMIMDV